MTLKDQPLKILIADDHPLIRVGLKQILIAGFGKILIGEARDANTTLDQIARADWDILVLDITMPGRSGLDVLRDIKQIRPKLPVLILTSCPEDQFAMRVLKVGAAGFLPKDGAPDELVIAIKKIIAGGKYITPALAEKLAFQLRDNTSAAPHETLSNREFEVLCLIARGKTPTQIAKTLSLSVKTISTYRARILEKLHLTTNAQLTYYAIKNGLVE